MLGISELLAQSPNESTVPGINEIVLFEKVANGLRVAEVYMGKDDKESRSRYLKWAESYNVKSPADYKKFILFSLRPKKLTENNRLVRELLKELEIQGKKDVAVSGIIRVYENQIELNGRSWLLVKKPRIIKQAARDPAKIIPREERSGGG